MKRILHGIIGVFVALIEDCLRNFPTYLGIILRNRYWKGKCRKYGVQISLGKGVVITGTANIELGNHISIMAGSFLYAHNNGFLRIGDWVTNNTNVQIGAADGGDITIGDNVIIGPNVVIRASNHVYERTDIPIRQQGHTGGRIVIEDDVWIAANAVILPDVKIGKGAIVAAGAVVTGDVPQYQIVGGVPARMIGSRKV